MTAPAADTARSSEFRTAIYYFTAFMSGGAATTYAGIWFTGKGLTPGQIGVINAVPVFVMLVLNLVVGRIADRASDWRQTIVLGSIVSALFPIGLFFVHDFWGILLFWSLGMIAAQAIVPVADAAAMRLTRRRGTDFGAIRAWASIGFMLVLVATGYLVVWLGPAVFLPLYVGLGLLRGATALGLPHFRSPQNERAPPVGATRLREVVKPWFVLPLFGWSMVYSTHLVLNAFQALLWKEQGIPADIIGILIAVGVVAETAMFFAFKRFFAGRFTARHLILISAIVTVVRWVAMGFSPGVPVLFGLQLLHSVTYALGFLGCLNFIANWTSEDIAAEAQSFFVVIQQGLAVLAFIAFGWLVAGWGAHAYFASASFAAAGGVLIWVSIRLKQPKAAPGFAAAAGDTP